MLDHLIGACEHTSHLPTRESLYQEREGKPIDTIALNQHTKCALSAFLHPHKLVWTYKGSLCALRCEEATLQRTNSSAARQKEEREEGRERRRNRLKRHFMLPHQDCQREERKRHDLVLILTRRRRRAKERKTSSTLYDLSKHKKQA